MSNITTFNFDALQVRAVLRDGEPWFVASDVCAVLEVADVRQAVERLDDSERGGCTVPTPGGPQEVRAVNESGMYALIFTSRKPEAQRFRRWVTSEVLPSIRRTGQYTARPAGGPSNLEQLQMAEVLASALRLDGSSRLKLMADATKLLAPALAPLLPAYAIDAPDGSATASSEPTESLTALMARFRVGVSTRAGNLILQERGLLEKRTRPSSGGTTKSFWSVTEKGQAFGKNVISPESPRETQPHWFSRKGEELLRVMGVQE